MVTIIKFQATIYILKKVISRHLHLKKNSPYRVYEHCRTGLHRVYIKTPLRTFTGI